MSFKLAHSYDFSVLLYSVHFTHFAAHTTANICMLLELILVVSMLTVHRIHSFTFGLKWHAIATSRRSIGMQSNIGKKKVALVISYVGSNYHGLQINPNATVPFIETKLQQALVDIEAILPSNAGDLGKIDWSRSSRTDKGVHAARLIISAKLEIHPKWLDDSEKNNGVAGTGENLAPARYKKLVCDLNSRLPSDIRAMSCIRINNSFQARDACTWREYEYLLPVDVLTSPSATTSDDTVHSDAQSNLYSIRKPAHLTSEEAVERFNAALQVFVGPQSFHNFNNIKTKEMNRFVSGVKHWEEKGQKGHHNNRNRELLSETVDDSEALLSESLGDSAEDVNATCISSDTETALKEGNNATESGSGRAFDLSYHIHEDWQPVERPMVNQVKHIIYRAQATLLTDASGKQMIAVSLRGSGFVLK